MLGFYGPIRKAVAVIMLFVAASSSDPARAQFVPGHIFVGKASSNLCETDCFGVPFDSEKIWELNPETGESSLFATIPREFCGFITGMAMSPDGKRLRIASWLQSAIFEFDAHGNMTIALDWWDGIRGPEGSNCIAYDREGNFYVSNFEGANVLKFPADGGPAQVIAEYDENDPRPMYAPRALTVDDDGTVYVATYTPDADVFRITPGGEVSLFDFYTGFNEVIISIAVDDTGTLFTLGRDQYNGHVYRYQGGNKSARKKILACEFDSNICGIGSLSMSDDRSLLVARHFRRFLFIDPVSTLYDEVIPPSPGNTSNSGTAIVPLRGDFGGEGGAGLEDYSVLESCLEGPNNIADPECENVDLDVDGDIDLFDFRFFQRAFGGSR